MADPFGIIGVIGVAGQILDKANKLWDRFADDLD